MGGWGSGQSPAPPGTDPCSTHQTEQSSECPAVSPAVEKHTNYVKGSRYSQEARQERGLGRGLEEEGTGAKGRIMGGERKEEGDTWQEVAGCGSGKRPEDGRV